MSNLLILLLYFRTEKDITFYGSSFICDNTGKKQKEADTQTKCILHHSFNLDQLQSVRSSWGLFRDRRPELYKPLLSYYGNDSNITHPTEFSSSNNSNFSMPAEWEKHDRCWMLWTPSKSDVWNEHTLKLAKEEFANVAKAISKHEVCIIINNNYNHN